ncbi:MAG: nuclear transport factor 2 family protein [Xanthobacteraceae bacterium]
MASEAENVATLKEGYRQWHESRGASVDHWMSICDEDIRFGSIAQAPPGVSYLTGYNGRAALGQYFNGLRQDWEMIDYVVDEFVAQGDRVVMLGRCTWRFRKNGRVVATPKADAWRFANGKAVEFFEYFDTAQLRDVVSE